MRKANTLSMKFSLLAPIPLEELAKRKKLEEIDSKDLEAMHESPSTEDSSLRMRRDDFLKKDFVLPNLQSRHENVEHDKVPVPVLERKAAYLNMERDRINEFAADSPTESLLARFTGHTHAVVSCVVAKVDGEEYLFTGSMDCTIRIFSVVSGQCIRVLEGHKSMVSSLYLFSVVGPDRAATKSREIYNTLNPQWDDRETDTFTFKLSHTDKLIQLRVFDWDKTGQHDFIGSVELRLREDILCGRDAHNPTVTEWYPLVYREKSGDRGFLQVEFHWEHGMSQLSIFLIRAKKLPKMDILGSADPYVTFTVKDRATPRLFSGSGDGTARCWDLASSTTRVVYKGHERAVTRVHTTWAFAKQHVFTASLDKTVRMWELETGVCLKIFNQPAGVTCMVLQTIMAEGTKNVTEEMINLPAEARVKMTYEYNPVNQTQKLVVLIEKARNIPAMDKLGLCDPFMTVTVGEVTFNTKTEKQTLNPSFNEEFVFTDFETDSEIVFNVYDWDAVGNNAYIGHIAFLVEDMKKKRIIHEWFPIDHDPYSKTFIYTGGSDCNVRMFDVRLGVELRCFSSHMGAVTDLLLTEVHSRVQLFSSSQDNTIKMWDLRKTGSKQDHAVRSWVHPEAVTSLTSEIIVNSTRIFGGCQDGKIYMWSLPPAPIALKANWRAKLAERLASIYVAAVVLLFILLDVAAAIVFEFGIPDDQKDCFDRDSFTATAIVFAVLAVFVIELVCNIIAHGRTFFYPLSLWNYLDLFVVSISVAVALYKVYFDFSLVINDENNKRLDLPPPVVSLSNDPILCNYTQAGGAGGAATTQTSMTAIRATRVIARITVAIRLLRAIIKAAKIAKRLGDLQRGKQFKGHTQWVSCLQMVAPDEIKETTWQRLYRILFSQNQEAKHLADYRKDLKRRFRLFSGSADGSVIMWDPTISKAKFRRDAPKFEESELNKPVYGVFSPPPKRQGLDAQKVEQKVTTQVDIVKIK